MPVEIKELIVRTNIVADEGQRNAGSNALLSKEDKQEIIKSCMKQVEKLMKKKQQR